MKLGIELSSSNLLRTDTTESGYLKLESLRKLRAIGVLTLSALTLSADGESTTYAVDNTAQVETSAAVDRDVFDDMFVLAVDNPNDSINARQDYTELSAKFEAATDAISRTLDGHVVAPESVPVVAVEMAPSGTRTLRSGNTVACYSVADIKGAKNNALNRQGDVLSAASDEVLVPVSIESDAVFCDETLLENAVGYHIEGGLEGGVYLRSTLKGAEGGEGLIVHELGHNWIEHSGALAHKDQGPLNNHPGYDFVDMIQSGEYKFVTNNEGTSIDAYANSTSAMGSMHSTEYDVYNFVEMHNLHPEAAPIREVQDREGSYEIGAGEGQVRGVMVDIPQDHPLRQIGGGENINQLYFGLSTANGDDIASLQFIARDTNNRTFAIETMSYIPALDAKRGEMEVFRDSSLNMIVSAESDSESAENGTSTMRLNIRPLN